ncbi:hypothetical protein [Laspinema olomoucense]|uniref:hypothetical protein n=1 Tax=Laspinema olomoucense TaxID=3231600 RepID=UPI0021BAEE94|nr:hypothetical protein [Laspinema sp. D3d]MCT7971083.1 hypothetical protein [Laspinema sp. D3d]
MPALNSLILTPDDPEFSQWLGIPPPTWQAEIESRSGDCVLVADAASGLLRPASSRETDEYLYGGEYDERRLSLLEVEVEDAYDYEDV